MWAVWDTLLKAERSGVPGLQDFTGSCLATLLCLGQGMWWRQHTKHSARCLSHNVSSGISLFSGREWLERLGITSRPLSAPVSGRPARSRRRHCWVPRTECPQGFPEGSVVVGNWLLLPFKYMIGKQVYLKYFDLFWYLCLSSMSWESKEEQLQKIEN